MPSTLAKRDKRGNEIVDLIESEINTPACKLGVTKLILTSSVKK